MPRRRSSVVVGILAPLRLLHERWSGCVFDMIDGPPLDHGTTWSRTIGSSSVAGFPHAMQSVPGLIT
jgi:hypothetical protein